MSTRGIIQASLEGWGSIICVILLITSMLDKEYKSESKRYLLWLYTTVGLSMISDALAWVFRGWPGTLGFVMVHASNFLAFELNCMIMMVYTLYVRTNLPQAGRKSMRKWIRLLAVLSAALMIVLVLNLFTKWIYFIDENNFYHRGALHWITVVVGLVGTLTNGVFLIRYRKDIEKGMFPALLSYVVLPTMALIALMFYYGLSLLHVAMCVAMVSMFIAAFKAHYMRMMEHEREMSDMKTQLMISQIEPHFLYNCLTTIKYLCRTAPDLAADAVDEFSQFLRRNLDGLSAKRCIPFRNEVEQVRNYLALEQRRFGERLQVEWHIEDEDFSIPPLTLQPIVENAVRHGLMRKPGGGTVSIRSCYLPEGFVITVQDDGVGFDPQELERKQTEAENTGRNIGLRNVKSRLALMRKGTMKIESKIGEGTTITLILPDEE